MVCDTVFGRSKQGLQERRHLGDRLLELLDAEAAHPERRGPVTA
jgi:hypothetical protein